MAAVADCLDTGSQILRLPPWYEKGKPGLIGKAERPNLVAPQILMAGLDLGNQALMERARAAMRLIVEEELGGSWWGRQCPRGWTADQFKAMAVAIPQKAEDMPVIKSMLAEVERNLPKEKTLILAKAAKSTPALGSSLRRLQKKGATVMEGEVNPWKVFPAVSVVHAAGHDIGFLALLAGKPVVCHGPAFYAGWGLTQDRAPAAKRLSRRTLVELFAAKFLLAARYRDPYSGKTISLEDALEIVRFFRRIDTANRSIGVCMGMAFWKKARIAGFLNSSEGAPRFTRSVKKAVRHAAKQGKAIAVWASREPAELAGRAAAAGAQVIRVEDGFIRSAGLGADFIPPCSITLDGEGLYFDPAQPSGLERILDTLELEKQDILRTRKLIALLVSRNITKYSAGAGGELNIPRGRPTILVPGQVEDDRSVLMGGGEIFSNLELLCRVRADNPDAHILYRPHPDVRAGHRPGEIKDGLVLRHADQILRTGSMGELIARVSEIHCLTSLAGFEALLRGKRVVTYGQPFYAGWGLTIDRNPPPRRGRNLTLEHLVAGTLLHYARYFDPLTKLPCPAEVLIARLEEPDLWRPSVLVRLRRVEGRVVYFLRAVSRRLFLTEVIRREAP